MAKMATRLDLCLAVAMAARDGGWCGAKFSPPGKFMQVTWVTHSRER